jgi:hypothetical protein
MCAFLSATRSIRPSVKPRIRIALASAKSQARLQAHRPRREHGCKNRLLFRREFFRVTTTSGAVRLL